MDRANTASPLQGPAFVQTNCNKAEGCFPSPGKGEVHSWPEETKKEKGDVGIPGYKLCPWLHSSSWIWSIVHHPQGLQSS